MKTKTLRLPVLFASAGAILCTVSVARAADSSLEIRQDQSTTQKEVINEPSGADRSYSTRIESGPAYGASTYSTQTYESGAALDPDAENDRLLHMYQRGRAAAESLDRQVKPNPVVVLPGAMEAESFRTSQTFQHPSELHQQQYSSSFNEPAAAERESTSTSTSTRRYSTSDASSTAMLSSGTTIRASDLMGMNIKNDQGQRIGEVKDVVLDLKSGRVAYAVVSANDKWLAVPPTVFTRTGASKTLTWNIENEKLQTAPTIDKSNWNAALQQDYIGNVYSFYGLPGYKAESEVTEPAGTEKNLQFHHDSEHQEQKQERQDKDQSRNDASRSDVSGQSAGASTQSSEQSDLQKSQPEKSASSSADVSKEAAGAQPSASATYSSGQSSSSSSQPQSSSSSSEQKSSTDINAPAGAQSSSSSSSDVNAEKQSSSSSTSGLNESAGATAPSSSAETSSTSGALPDRVQMALKNDASLSTSAQNVQFSMDNDKLVIKGTVKSEDEKNRILEKVRATAGSTEIDDQLKVSPSSDSNSSSDSSSDSSDSK